MASQGSNHIVQPGAKFPLKLRRNQEDAPVISYFDNQFIMRHQTVLSRIQNDSKIVPPRSHNRSNFKKLLFYWLSLCRAAF